MSAGRVASAGTEEIVIEIRDRRKPGFFIVDHEAVRAQGKIIGPFGGAVYLSIVSHANQERESWPSLELIADEWAISKREVIRAIKRLEDCHMIRRAKQGRRNIYSLLDKDEWVTPDQIGDCESPIDGRNRCLSVTKKVTVSHSIGDCESPEVELRSITKKKTPPTSPEAVALATLLLQRIRDENPRSTLHAMSTARIETTVAGWAQSIDKLVRIDRQPAWLIERVIHAATRDAFWGRNILSGQSVREHWDKIVRLVPSADRLPRASPGGSTDPGISAKPRASYTRDAQGHWCRIEGGQQIRVSEDQVPQGVKDREAGKTPAVSMDPQVKSMVERIVAGEIDAVATAFGSVKDGEQVDNG